MEKGLKKQLAKNREKGLGESIKIFFMENFRKLSMGIQAQFDSMVNQDVRVGSSPTFENIVVGTIRFLGRTLLSIPKTGTMEFAGNKFYITNNGHQRVIDRTSDVAIETVTVANTTTETTLWTGEMGANSLIAGNVFKFHADGIVSNNSANANDEVTIRVKVGGITKVTLSPDTKQLSDTMWHIDANATQRTIGATGQRAMHIHLVIGNPITTGDEVFSIGVITIDTTANTDVTITAQWASANAANTISLYQGFMEYRN